MQSVFLFFVSCWVLVAVGGEECCEEVVHFFFGEFVGVVKIP